MMSFRGQASWAKMTSPRGKLTELSCHPTKKVNQAEQLAYLSTNIAHTQVKPKVLGLAMDKLQLTGRALGRVYHFRCGCMHTMHLLPSVAIQPNLELKTRPKPVLGSLPLAFALPGLACITMLKISTKDKRSSLFCQSISN